MNSTVYTGIGLMCGTSRDGLDIVEVRFSENATGWSHDIIWFEEVPLPGQIQSDLSRATTASALELHRLNLDLGRFFGSSVNNARKRNGSKATFIASHGITIFHDPNNHGTLQIGSGAELAALTQLPCIVDFRSLDVAKGGQGAPLVPSIDSLLFQKYDATLNLGGFANVALSSPTLIGYDVGPCNLVLNHLAAELGLDYDINGSIAAKGAVNKDLLEALNKLNYYHQGYPKSLGTEWLETEFLPVLETHNHLSVEDRMATCVEHIAYQLEQQLSSSSATCLVTGGGALNEHLRQRLNKLPSPNFVFPDELLIRAKESVCFAMMGLLRLQNRVNISASVTGASSDSVSGTIYHP